MEEGHQVIAIYFSQLKYILIEIKCDMKLNSVYAYSEVTPVVQTCI